MCSGEHVLYRSVFEEDKEREKRKKKRNERHIGG